jgi:hypothetical protein
MGLSGSLQLAPSLNHKSRVTYPLTPRSVLVVESRSRVGGRLHSPYGADLGGSWLWDGDTRVEKLAERFGLGERMSLMSCWVVCLDGVVL